MLLSVVVNERPSRLQFCALQEVALAAGADRGLAEIAAHGGRAAARAIEHGIELAYLACPLPTLKPDNKPLELFRVLVVLQGHCAMERNAEEFQRIRLHVGQCR